MTAWSTGRGPWHNRASDNRSWANPWGGHGSGSPAPAQAGFNWDSRSQGWTRGGTGGRTHTSSWINPQTGQYERAGSLGEVRPLAGAGAGAGGGARGVDRIEQSRRDILDMTRGRAEDILQDPFTNDALNALRTRELPYGAQAVNAMRAGAFDSNAAAEAQQNEALAGSNVALDDPSAQAARRASASARQRRNAQAQQQIDQQASVANFQADLQRQNAIAAVRAAQNALANQSYGQAANFLSADTYSRNIAAGMRDSGGAEDEDERAGWTRGALPGRYGGFWDLHGTNLRQDEGGRSNWPFTGRVNQHRGWQVPTMGGAWSGGNRIA